MRDCRNRKCIFSAKCNYGLADCMFAMLAADAVAVRERYCTAADSQRRRSCSLHQNRRCKFAAYFQFWLKCITSTQR